MTEHISGITIANDPGKVHVYVMTKRRFRDKPKVKQLKADQVVLIELNVDGADQLRNMVIDPGEYRRELV